MYVYLFETDTEPVNLTVMQYAYIDSYRYKITHIQVDLK